MGKPKKVTPEVKKSALKLLGMGLTMKQVAYYHNLSVKALEENTTQTERDAARAGVQASLINTAYKQAIEGGSERMLIFLLKTQLGWSEGKGDLEARLTFEKELLKYKKEIGYTEIQTAPIEIYLNEPQHNTPDYLRNVIEADNEAITASKLALDAPEG